MWRAEWPRRTVLLLLLAASAAIAYFTDAGRPESDRGSARFAVEVTTSGDRGPGSLREAIFTAVQSRTVAHIVIRVPRVVLTEPLPPVTHDIGFVLEAEAPAVIDAGALTVAAVLEIRAPHATVRNVALAGAPQVALLLRAPSVSLEKIAIDDADVGVVLAPEVSSFDIHGGEFSRNRIAIQSSVVTAGAIVDNRFSENTGTAVWIVGAAGDGADQRSVRVLRNRFEKDNDAIVVANRTAILEGNRVSDAAHVAVTLRDADATLKDNVIRGARLVGVLIEGGSRVDVAGNEISASPGTGILLAAARDARISGNRLFANYDGIVQLAQLDAKPPLISDNLVYEQARDGIRIVGSSPVVRGNRSMHNLGAGLRMIDAVADSGRLLEARPLLDRNIFAGNRSGELARIQVRR